MTEAADQPTTNNTPNDPIVAWVSGLNDVPGRLEGDAPIGWSVEDVAPTATAYGDASAGNNLLDRLQRREALARRIEDARAIGESALGGAQPGITSGSEGEPDLDTLLAEELELKRTVFSASALRPGTVTAALLRLGTVQDSIRRARGTVYGRPSLERLEADFVEAVQNTGDETEKGNLESGLNLTRQLEAAEAETPTVDAGVNPDEYGMTNVDLMERILGGLRRL